MGLRGLRQRREGSAAAGGFQGMTRVGVGALRAGRRPVRHRPAAGKPRRGRGRLLGGRAAGPGLRGGARCGACAGPGSAGPACPGRRACALLRGGALRGRGPCCGGRRRTAATAGAVTGRGGRATAGARDADRHRSPPLAGLPASGRDRTDRGGALVARSSRRGARPGSRPGRRPSPSDGPSAARGGRGAPGVSPAGAGQRPVARCGGTVPGEARARRRAGGRRWSGEPQEIRRSRSPPKPDCREASACQAAAGLGPLPCSRAGSSQPTGRASASRAAYGGTAEPRPPPPRRRRPGRSPPATGAFRGGAGLGGGHAGRRGAAVASPSAGRGQAGARHPCGTVPVPDVAGDGRVRVEAWRGATAGGS